MRDTRTSCAFKPGPTLTAFAPEGFSSRLRQGEPPFKVTSPEKKKPPLKVVMEAEAGMTSLHSGYANASFLLRKLVI